MAKDEARKLVDEHSGSYRDFPKGEAATGGRWSVEPAVVAWGFSVAKPSVKCDPPNFALAAF
jgi:hypothetical protein